MGHAFASLAYHCSEPDIIELGIELTPWKYTTLTQSFKWTNYRVYTTEKNDNFYNNPDALHCILPGTHCKKDVSVQKPLV